MLNSESLTIMHSDRYDICEIRKNNAKYAINAHQLFGAFIQ